MSDIIKAGVYKVEIEFKLEKDIMESELDEIFEEGISNHFDAISSEDIGRYILVKEEEN